jgi:Na+/proline symporter
VNEDAVGGLISLILMVCIGLPFLAVFLYSIFWAYNDAEKRGKSGCLVALLVFLLSWPVGLIVWLVIRPQEKSY